jgi:hypothetical protein
MGRFVYSEGQVEESLLWRVTDVAFFCRPRVLPPGALHYDPAFFGNQLIGRLKDGDAPDPGFSAVSETVCAPATSAAATANWR